MSQHSLALEISRAKEAQLLLDNPLLSSALGDMKAEIVAQWSACPARDKEGKETLWQLLKTAEKFENLLKGHIETGKLAAENLRRIEDENLRQRMVSKLRSI